MTRLPFPSTAIVVFASSLLYAASVETQAPHEYHVTRTYSLGVEGGYDYMSFDPASHLLYIAQETQVVVFNPAKGAVTGKIAGMSHTHGIVFDKDGKTGYISDGGANVIRVFDRGSLKEITQIAVGTNPDGMVIEPASNHLFAFNGRSKNLSVVDLASRKVIATVPLPGKPEFPTTDGAGHVFDNIEDTHQVVEISAANNKVIATWTITGCESPSGMAIDVAAHRIASVCDNGKMPVIDTGTGKIVAMAAIGTGADAAAYDAAQKTFFSSNGDSGDLSVVKQQNANTYATIQTVKTAPKGRTVALNSADGKLYIIAPDPQSSAPAASKPLILIEISR
jgi:YVTN family beta-propeller protein